MTTQQSQPKPQQQVIPKREWRRLQGLNVFEQEARQQGYSILAGIDEAGRGPLAGPVVAAACILPHDFFLEGVDDSKKLSAKERSKLYAEICANPSIIFAIGVVSNSEIDEVNILQATIKAMIIAVEALALKPDLLFVDGLKLPYDKIPSQKIIGGDARSHTIATASVIAKHTRDQLMIEADAQWPEYGFAQHKGYGTEMHLEAISKHGPCPIHRLSFAPLKNVPVPVPSEAVPVPEKATKA